jgi:hypothetical protein
MTTRSLSALLEDLKARTMGEEVTLQTLLEAFHERGFGFFLLLFALPAALPVPAIGLNAIIALPLLILTAQQAMGRHTIWLPESWLSKSVSKEKIDGYIDSANPWVKKIETFIRPRLPIITQGFSSNMIGILGFFMALAVSIPLPLTNTVPSIGIVCMAIGVIMRDGLAVIIGILIGIGWIVLLSWLILFFGSEAIDLVKTTIKGFV